MHRGKPLEAQNEQKNACGCPECTEDSVCPECTGHCTKGSLPCGQVHTIERKEKITHAKSGCVQ
eukprot:1156933-Pelagomonas_calceolata.AAC.5